MHEELVSPPGSSALPFQVHLSGISYCDGSYHIHRTHSTVTCIEYILKGCGTVREDGKCFCAREGDIYLLHEGREHDYFSDADDPWEKIWMNLSGSVTEHLLTAYGLSEINHITGLDLRNDFYAFYRAARSAKNEETVQEQCGLMFHRILLKIAAYLREVGVGEKGLARKVRDRIDQTAGWDLDLGQLSEEFFFSKEHLIREFKKEYRITPYEYILNRKLNLAKELLKNTSLSVSGISDYLNFCDSHYFTDFFRKRTGIPPRDYRKKHRENKYSSDLESAPETSQKERET